MQKRVFYLLLFFLCFSSVFSIAAPLEDITLSNEKNRVIATIKLTNPISNVRYAPPKKGRILSILFDRVSSGTSKIEWIDNEVLKSPPSDVIPSFTVKTNLKNIQPKFIIEFSEEAEYTVQIGRDGRSIVLGIQIDKPSSLPTPVTISTKIQKSIGKFDGSLPALPDINTDLSNATDIDKKAMNLMFAARGSLAINDNFVAIDTLNKLLLLPPNKFTQDAQEWVGVARERAGQLDKAKLELELYLKLYNDPEDAKRIKHRLASLGKTPPQSPSVTADSASSKKKVSQTISYGSISMSYYRGNSKTDSVDTNPQLSGTSQFSFSGVDQSALITSVIASERFISDAYDNRLVFQDTSYTNYLPGQASNNKMGAAYFESKNKISDYSIRLGRQSSSGGGVLGRFDGVTFGLGFGPSLQFKAVSGQLSDYVNVAKPTFYGMSVDLGSVTLYAISQQSEDIVERKAIGSEIRYFDTNKNAFMLLDYDTLFSQFNVALLQATYVDTPERTYSLFVDHRRTPYLSVKNALYGALTTSIADLLQYLTIEEVRTLAANRTGTSNMAQVGVSQQVSPKWQIGGDVRLSKFDTVPASGLAFDPLTMDVNAPPVELIQGYTSESESTGYDWGISQQIIGTNLYSTRDVTVISLSEMGSSTYKGQSMFIYSHANLSDKWSVDLSLQFYRQQYDSGMLSRTMTPSIRTSYQLRESLNLNMDAGYQYSTTEIGTQLTESTRQFMSLGIRLDF